MDDWLANLSSEDLNFIKNFVLSSGSLKSVAKKYSVSYPTVRSRLNDIINKINVADEISENEEFVIKIMKMFTNNEISLSTSKKIINIYKKEKEEHE